MHSLTTVPLFMWAFFMISTPEAVTGGNPHTDEDVNDIKYQIEAAVCYPEFGKQMLLEEKVQVQFKVDDRGILEVKEVESETDTMKGYVRSILDGAAIEIADQFKNKWYRIELDFRLF